MQSEIAAEFQEAPYHVKEFPSRSGNRQLVPSGSPKPATRQNLPRFFQTTNPKTGQSSLQYEGRLPITQPRPHSYTFQILRNPQIKVIQIFTAKKSKSTFSSPAGNSTAEAPESGRNEGHGGISQAFPLNNSEPSPLKNHGTTRTKKKSKKKEQPFILRLLQRPPERTLFSSRGFTPPERWCLSRLWSSRDCL